MVEMPRVPLNDVLKHLSEEEYVMVQAILKNGKLKASPPPIKYEYVEGIIRFKRPSQPSGSIAFLWALAAYELSPYRKHAAAPPDHRMYLTSGGAAVRLKEVAELLCKSVPMEFHYGLTARGVV